MKGNPFKYPQTPVRQYQERSSSVPEQRPRHSFFDPSTLIKPNSKPGKISDPKGTRRGSTAKVAISPQFYSFFKIPYGPKHQTRHELHRM